MEEQSRKLRCATQLHNVDHRFMLPVFQHACVKQIVYCTDVAAGDTSSRDHVQSVQQTGQLGRSIALHLEDSVTRLECRASIV